MSYQTSCPQSPIQAFRDSHGKLTFQAHSPDSSHTHPHLHHCARNVWKLLGGVGPAGEGCIEVSPCNKPPSDYWLPWLPSQNISPPHPEIEKNVQCNKNAIMQSIQKYTQKNNRFLWPYPISGLLPIPHLRGVRCLRGLPHRGGLGAAPGRIRLGTGVLADPWYNKTQRNKGSRSKSSRSKHPIFVGYPIRPNKTALKIFWILNFSELIVAAELCASQKKKRTPGELLCDFFWPRTAAAQNLRQKLLTEMPFHSSKIYASVHYVSNRM